MSAINVSGMVAIAAGIGCVAGFRYRPDLVAAQGVQRVLEGGLCGGCNAGLPFWMMMIVK